MYCACRHPSAFTFVEYGTSTQIWIHVKCGGMVVMPLIRKKG